MLKFIVSTGSPDVLPNLCIALQILLTIAIPVATCEQSFSKLKLIANTIQGAVSVRLLSVEQEAACKLNFSDFINRFAMAKAQ